MYNSSDLTNTTSLGSSGFDQDHRKCKVDAKDIKINNIFICRHLIRESAVMSFKLLIFVASIACAWCRPSVVYLGPSSSAEIVDTDGTVIQAYSSSGSSQNDLVSFDYGSPHYGLHYDVPTGSGASVAREYLQEPSYTYGQVNSVVPPGFTQIHQTPVYRQHVPVVYKKQPQVYTVENPTYYAKSAPSYLEHVNLLQRTVLPQQQHYSVVRQQEVVAQSPVESHPTIIAKQHVVVPQQQVLVPQQQVVVPQQQVVVPQQHVVVPQQVVRKTVVVPQPVVAKSVVVPQPVIVPQPITTKSVVVPQPVVSKTVVVPQPVVTKKTVVKHTIDQTHPSPVVVPVAPVVVHQTPEVQLSIHSEPVHLHSSDAVEITASTPAPVVFKSSTAVPVIVAHPTPVPVVVAHPTPVVSTVVANSVPIVPEVLAKTVPVVSQAVPVVTKTIVEVPSVAVETKVVESAASVTTAEESELVPLTSGKVKEAEPVAKVVPVKTHRISAHFIAEGPDATFVAPGTGLRGQYVQDKEEHKHDDGSYKGEFYHGIGKVIKLEQQHV